MANQDNEQGDKQMDKESSEAGKCGGQQSDPRSHRSGLSQQGGTDIWWEGSGGSGNFSNDPQSASEVGRKGGEQSDGGK